MGRCGTSRPLQLTFSLDRLSSRFWREEHLRFRVCILIFVGLEFFQTLAKSVLSAGDGTVFNCDLLGQGVPPIGCCLGPGFKKLLH